MASSVQKKTEINNPEKLLKQLFNCAISQALPTKTITEFVPQNSKGKTVIIGCGKASALMAKQFDECSDLNVSGLVVAPYGNRVKLNRIEVIEAAHPVPDQNSVKAAERLLSMASKLGESDLLIFLVSGGGSAMTCLPAPGLSIIDKQSINEALLKCGANIKEMNCVRKHLSAIKGGQLAAAAYPAKTLTLALSDIPGDDPSVIASGPTVADITTSDDALKIIKKYRIEAPSRVLQHFRAGKQKTPKPGDKRLSKTELHLVCNPQMALEAAAELAKKNGITPYILSDALEGESKDVAMVHSGIVKQIIKYNQPFKKPCVILSGGETTVTVKGKGRGGRNTEFLLALAIALDGLKGVWAIAGDTDGIDGIEDNAGAIIGPSTIDKANAIGIDPSIMLVDNNAYTFFEKIDDLILTGPTNTNVNDFRAIIVT